MGNPCGTTDTSATTTSATTTSATTTSATSTSDTITGTGSLTSFSSSSSSTSVSQTTTSSSSSSTASETPTSESSSSSSWTPPPPPPVECPCDCDCDRDCGTDKSNGGTYTTPECPPDASESPVRYFNGEVELVQTDLSGEGFGLPWGHVRTYSNRFGYSYDYGNGFDWQVRQWPILGEDSGTGNLFVVRGAGNVRWFDGTTLAGKFGSKDSLTYASTPDEYTFATADGEKYVFYGFNGTGPAGRAISYTTPGGQVINFHYNAYDALVEASWKPVGESFTNRLVYDYFHQPSVNAGRLRSVTLTREYGGSGQQPILKAEYSYHDGSSAYGNLGDLEGVAHSHYTSSGWDYDGGAYYRYYKDAAGGIGFQHGLRYVLGSDTLYRLDQASIDPRTLSNPDIEQYADYAFKYDGSRRVTEEKVNWASRTYSFSYTSSGTGGTDYNVWQMKTVETRPTGGGTITVYTNFVGQVLLRKVSDGANNFINYYKYDSDGHLILHAEPAAVVSYDDNQSNLGVTLQSSSGLLHIYQYYSSNTSPAAKGYLQFEAVREGYQSGSSTNDSRIREYEYGTQTGGGVTVRPVTKMIAYPYANNTSYAINTLFGYTWISGTVQMLKRVTTLPAVPTTQNGTNTTAERWDQFDEFGNPIWFKDERGYITRQVYDAATRALTQTVQDTNQNLPSGWSAISGSHLNLTTDYTNDSRGRVTEVLGPAHDVSGTTVRTASWTVYIDGVNPEVWTTQGYLSGGTRYVTSPVAPVSITVMDPDGRVTRTVLSKRQTSPPPSAQLTAAEVYTDQSRWVRWTENHYDDHSRLEWSRVYFNIPSAGSGTSANNYNQTGFDYDALDRQDGATTPGGTITRTVFDVRSLPTAVWVGTDDTGYTPSNPTGSGSNNLKTVRSMVYDANSNITQDRRPVDSTSGHDRVATNSYDFRNRLVATTGLTSNYYMGKGYDNLNRQTVDLQNDISISPYTYVAVQLTDYDDRGHVFQKRRWVTPGSFPSGNVLVDSFWYDDAGHQIQSKPSGSSRWTKQVYDQVGRVNRQYTGYGTGGPTSVSSDLIFEQHESTYDDASNLIWTVSRRRFDNAPTSGTGSAGELQTPTTQPNARVTFLGNYFDQIGRLTDVVNWGNNGDVTTLTRPSAVPSRSDTVLVTTTGYNDRGEADQTYDPSGSSGKQTLLVFDHGGRVTQQVQNKVTSPITYDQNRTTNFEYTADGQLKKLTAVNSVTGDQTTEYCYGTTLSDSQLASSQLLRGVIYADSTNTWDPINHTFSGATYNRVEYQRNRQGEIIQIKDQNQSVHDYEYDGLGRMTKDTVSALGTNIDNAVRRIERSYTLLGMPEKVTSFGVTSGGSPLNQVQFDYNALGQLIKEYQEHGAAVSTGSSLNVEYDYEPGSANTVRRKTLKYPGPTTTRRLLTYGYNTGPDTNLSRISKISDGGTDQVDYAYLGLGMVAIMNLLPPQLRWTLARSSRYDVLDNFDRLKAFTWFDYGSSGFPERLDYTYDRLGNRLSKQRVLPVAAGNDEKYTNDELYRLVDLTRGTLSGGSITSATFRQNWQIPSTTNTGVDPTGNWRKFRQDDTNGGSSWTFAQSRDHDKANTLTGITTDSGSPTWNSPPGHDQAGNMTTVPQPASPANAYGCTYDAWNRLVKVVDGSNTVEEYAYDGFHRRTIKKKYASGSLSETRHYYYSDAWQVLEERVDNSGTLDIDRQFIWGLRYIDDLIRRDRYSSGSINETRFAIQDANFNVTAVTDNNGDVQERYRYDAYGMVTALNASFTLTGNPPANDWETLYAGYRWDSKTGLYCVRHRVYHPALGHWMQKDPLSGPNPTNLYNYCGNQPLILTDPFGLQAGLQPSNLICGKVAHTLISLALAGAHLTPPPPIFGRSIRTIVNTLGGCENAHPDCRSRTIPDVVFGVTKRARVYEIKPNNAAGLAMGTAQLAGYISKLNKCCLVATPGNCSHAQTTGGPIPTPNCGTLTWTCAAGIISYTLTPNIQPVPVQPVPVPVPIPRPVPVPVPVGVPVFQPGQNVVVDFVTEHPVLTTVIVVGVVAGVIFAPWAVGAAAAALETSGTTLLGAAALSGT